MSDDLLENARQQAEKAEPSMRAAALLRIARAESVQMQLKRERRCSRLWKSSVTSQTRIASITPKKRVQSPLL
jgi:hypothetical protein